MKKIISIWLCACIIIYIASPIGFAFQTEEHFSIENYTLSDILQMSSDEQIELLRKYEEEYDPSGLNDVCIDQATSYTTIVLYKILRVRGFI